jgi:tryptophanyl-tRNA synthetase
MAQFTQRVFSGVQPTGNLHLGNYLGALKRFVEMQATHPCIYCVVDLHAMTMPYDPAQLASATRQVTATYLAYSIRAACPNTRNSPGCSTASLGSAGSIA